MVKFVKILIKRCFILDMFKNVVKISCMLEIYALVQKCRVVTGVVSGTRGVTNVMKLYARASKSPAVKKDAVW